MPSPSAKPPTSSTRISPVSPAGPRALPWPAANELARATSNTVGACFRRHAASWAPRCGGGLGRGRRTANTAAASVGEVTAPSSTAVHASRPNTKWPNNAISPTLTPTPTVASTVANPAESRMSFHFVVRPPSAKMTTSAPKPSAWAKSAFSNSTPKPDSPNTMPSPRKSSSEGSPTPLPIRAPMMAAISTTALTSKMRSRLIMLTSFPNRVTGRETRRPRRDGRGSNGLRRRERESAEFALSHTDSREDVTRRSGEQSN